MDSKPLHKRLPAHEAKPRRGADWLHRLSDSALHICLLIAVLGLGLMALHQASQTEVTLWRLDTVVIHGQPKR